ncbi:MAG: MoaD/ThiS family protein [Anaerolineae bacterium]|nr:MoaD/ThiS family protein [Anaerolineae bacterium]
MDITVRFFASLRADVGTNSTTLHIPAGADLTALVEQVVTQYPQLAGHQAMWHFAVNHVHAEPDTVLHAGDRVAIFPYVAGG